MPLKLPWGLLPSLFLISPAPASVDEVFLLALVPDPLRHEPVFCHVLPCLHEPLRALASGLPSTGEGGEAGVEFLHGFDIEPRAGLERGRELRQVIEVVELDGVLEVLPDLLYGFLCGPVCARPFESPLQHLLAEGEAESLAGDLLRRLVGQREYPVIAPRFRGVVRDVHLQGVEYSEELGFALRHRLRQRDPGPDVAHPGVASRFCDLLLLPPYVDVPPGSRVVDPVLLGGIHLVVGRLLLVRESGEPPLPGHVLQGPVQILRVLRMHPIPGHQVGAVDHDVRVGDPARVVVVVDDRDLVVREEAQRPGACELPQGSEVDVVLGIRGEHEVLERPGPHAVPWLIVAELGPGGVHLHVPQDQILLLLRGVDVLSLVP